MSNDNQSEPYVLKCPVLFLVFNRIETTKKVFAEIRKARPPRLYVAADGPRAGNRADRDKTKLVQDHIITNVDWNCEVITLFRDENLGCASAVSQAIEWFFEHEEMGIVLEDDCLPHFSFFQYCETLLEKYKHDERISLISGDGRLTSVPGHSFSYDFLNYALIWGWAGWRRTWEEYDLKISFIPDKTQISRLPGLNKSGRGVKRFWKRIYIDISNRNTWDYQLSLLLLKKNSLCIIPSKNLIQNIGFDGESTHFSNLNGEALSIPVSNIDFPLIHPYQINGNKELQRRFENQEFYVFPLPLRIIRKLQRFFSDIK